MFYGEISLMQMGLRRKGKDRERLFLWFLISIVSVMLFSGFNSVIYNWVFIPRVYEEPFNRWSVASVEMFLDYWRWLPGKVLCLLNVILGVLPFVLWQVLKRVAVNREC
jgi:hypothetical protein